MANLERAIEIAVAAHRNQTDKAGQPYILHPLRLMLQFEDEAARMAAILHDSVEDSALTLEALREEGFAPTIIGAVDALTKRENEPYDQYIRRVEAHPIARRVKLADLEHNMDIRRIGDIQERDLSRLKKYHQTWQNLRRPADF